MKTDASVEIVRWQGNELTVRLPCEIDKREMDFYIQHRRELYKRNMKSCYRCVFTVKREKIFLILAVQKQQLQ